MAVIVGQWQKILVTTIQVNFVLIPSEAGMRQHKFTWIVIIKIFVTNLPSQPFLGRHLYFTYYHTEETLALGKFGEFGELSWIRQILAVQIFSYYKLPYIAASSAC